MYFVVKNDRPMTYNGVVKMFKSLEDACKHPKVSVSWTVYAGCSSGVVATGSYFFFDGYEDKFVTETFVVYMCE